MAEAARPLYYADGSPAAARTAGEPQGPTVCQPPGSIKSRKTPLYYADGAVYSLGVGSTPAVLEGDGHSAGYYPGYQQPHSQSGFQSGYHYPTQQGYQQVGGQHVQQGDQHYGDKQLGGFQHSQYQQASGGYQQHHHQHQPRQQPGGSYQQQQQGFYQSPGQQGGTQEHHCCKNTDSELSIYDYRRYLPSSERRKQLVINTPEDLWNFHNCLLKELLWFGEDVRGFVDHMNYVSEMAKTGVFETRALVAYDEAMLERARRWGPVVFHGADTNLTNTKLGVAGTKAARVSVDGGKNRSTSYNNGNRSTGRQSYQGRKAFKQLTGWRKLAADHGTCFKFCQNQSCDGASCQFKHQCLHCDNLSHSMLDCPTKAGDIKA